MFKYSADRYLNFLLIINRCIFTTTMKILYATANIPKAKDGTEYK